MKTLKLFTTAFLVLNIFSVFSQSCFTDCSERLNRSVDTLVTADQMKKKIHESDPASANHKILNDLKGCEFPKTKLNTLNGNPLSIGDFKGKAVFVSFWFTSCATCIAEIPSINKLIKEYENSAVFISVNTDDVETLKEFLKNTSYKSQQAYISREDAYKDFCTIAGFPSNLILDKTGKVFDVWAGGGSDPAKKDDFYQRIKTGIDKVK